MLGNLQWGRSDWWGVPLSVKTPGIEFSHHELNSRTTIAFWSQINARIGRCQILVLDKKRQLVLGSSTAPYPIITLLLLAFKAPRLTIGSMIDCECISRNVSALLSLKLLVWLMHESLFLLCFSIKHIWPEEDSAASSLQSSFICWVPFLHTGHLKRAAFLSGTTSEGCHSRKGCWNCGIWRSFGTHHGCLMASRWLATLVATGWNPGHGSEKCRKRLPTSNKVCIKKPQMVKITSEPSNVGRP